MVVLCILSPSPFGNRSYQRICALTAGKKVFYYNENKKAAPHSRFNTARKISIFWTLFIGIGAVGGAVTMLIDPSGGLMGMDAMLPYFKKLPFADVLFTDFVFSGIALLIVNGITNLVAAALLFAKKNPAQFVQ